MLNRPKNSFAKSAAAALLAVGLSTSSALADTNDNSPKASFQQIAVQSDYVTDCKSNSCAPREAVGWSKDPSNENAVAVAVAMGELNQVPDYKIKSVLADEFSALGINNVRFFFEENDTQNTLITLHVRGGTQGPYFLDDRLFAGTEKAAKLAKYKHLESASTNNNDNTIVLAAN